MMTISLTMIMKTIMKRNQKRAYFTVEEKNHTIMKKTISIMNFHRNQNLRPVQIVK